MKNIINSEKKMTDLQKFTNMYKSFGIDVKINQHDDVKRIFVEFFEDVEDWDVNIGYRWISEFTMEGKFLEHSLWGETGCSSCDNTD